MKIQISKKDVIWNYVGTLFNMGIGYLLLPFLLLYLDENNLGLWYIFMNLASIANLFIFGFSPSFARNIAYCWNGAGKLATTGKFETDVKQESIDWQLFSVLMQTCRRIYLLIAAAAVLCLSIIGSVYLRIVAGHMMGTLHYIAWAIFLIAIFLNLFYGYYVSVLSGIGKVAEKNRAQVIAGISRVLLTGGLLYCGMGFLGACIAYLCYGWIFRILCKYYFEKTVSSFDRQEIKNCNIAREDLKECFMIIWPNTWRDGMVSVSDYLCTQAGTIVCSFFLPLSITGVYSLSVQLITVIAKLARSFQITFIPALQTAYIRDDKQEAKEIHSMCILVYCVVFCIGMCGMLIVGIPLIHIIKPEMELDKLLLCGVGVSQFLVVWRNCYASYLSTTNKVDYWKAFICSGGAAVLGSVILLQYFEMGIWGSVLATTVTELAYNTWKWTIQVHKELKLGGKELIYLGLKRLIRIIQGKV